MMLRGLFTVKRTMIVTLIAVLMLTMMGTVLATPTEVTAASPDAIKSKIASLLGLFQTVVGLGVVGCLIWAGFLFSSSGANPQKREQAKAALTAAAVGGFFVFAAWSIAGYIKATATL
mgnify:CR=1 FL=1